ncbi:VWA domain-containing protein [Rhodopirellula sp. JC740]|uniref:VWA domain-containing protein n=1 Tax=Rhodopirellula halodulae TaxID=2894198 RepID=A0ABS8NK03_9BACT|nr:VWA domain-containing protein [Rhodopirellula sp. JC740]MCC9643909.1 VWA domain-containing protein [Rhodopirellula sp. JC740]
MNDSEIQWGNPSATIWLVAVGLALLLIVGASAWRRRAWRRFMGTQVSPPSDRVKRGLSALCVLAAMLLMSISLLDLRWGKAWEEVPQRGIEAVFVLDVSRSMLAEDASPNRLDRAKQQISDMVDEMPGDRVGLVVFAGETRQVLPLTRHVEDFKQTLESVGMQSVRRGGSRLGDAIRVAADAFLDKTTDHKAMVILTDGEDQESDPVESAKRVHEEKGIRIFTIGLGDMVDGSRIPDVDPEMPRRQSSRYVKHKGQTVISKMNGAILKEVATQSDGAYIPAGTKRVDMSDVVHGYIANVDDADLQTAKINAFIPRFQWFVIPALLMLGLECLLRGWSPKRETVSVKRRSGHATAQAAAVLICLSLIGGNMVVAQDDGFTGEHLDRLGRASFNEGVQEFESGEYSAAEESFSKTVASADSELALRSRYNLGNCHHTRAISAMQTEPKSAMESLDVAIANYRTAIQVGRSLPRGSNDTADPAQGILLMARKNLELAMRLKKELEDQQQQGGNSGDSQQENNSQPSNEEPSEGEQNNEDQSASGDQDQSDSSGDRGESQSEGSEEASEEQSPQKQGDEQGSEASTDPQSDQGQKEGDQDAADDVSPDENGKTDSDGQLQSRDPSENEQDDGKVGAEAAEGNAVQQSMTVEEALKMLQAVRDRDMLRRFDKEQRERSRQIPVEKDW